MQRRSTPFSHPFHVVLKSLIPGLFYLLASGSSTYASVFHIECPPDVTVYCDAELSDLSVYGNAVVYGYGDPESAGPPISEDYNLGNCNTGNIVRTWVAYDYGGNPYYCSQTITVIGSGTANIQWPPDYVIHECNPSTDPGDLPPPYDHPVFDPYDECSQLLTNYEDLVFNINPPACKKILRKWTIIDWCLYDPHSYDPIGIYTHTQVIKIAPTNPPTLWCPPDTIVSAGADCTGGHVSLPLAYGSSDCGAGVIITNNSPYAYHHGADASGDYPLGTTKVTFWADDGCGQKVSCSTYITVMDLKKPTPLCYYGVSISLMMMPDGYYMDLRPSFFNKGSFDNCTPASELIMWVEPSRVDCDDLGETPVRVYVEDESGNVEYCNTVVYVQDNNGICPPDDGNIDGEVVNAKGEALSQVKVSLLNTSNYSMTNNEGSYAFSSLPFGNAYSISPSYSNNDMKGITALDMVAMLKHVLAIESFSSPYQYIAGDLDRSGRVSVNDLLAVRDLILQDNYGLGPKTSWRFVDASYVFQNPQDPLSEAFPEAYHIPAFNQNMQSVDFVGVKLGDINSDAKSKLTGETEILSRGGGVTLRTANKSFETDEVFEITISSNEFGELEAMQFALEIDRDAVDVLQVQSMHSGHGLDIINKVEEFGIVSALWYGAEPLETPGLFRIRLRALRDGSIDNVLALKEGTTCFAYQTGSDKPQSLNLEYSEEGGAQDTQAPEQAFMKVGPNTPNPFGAETRFIVELAEDSPLHIAVVNPDGRILYSELVDGIAGLQEITLNANQINAKGVVFCRVIAGEATSLMRMVINTVY